MSETIFININREKIINDRKESSDMGIHNADILNKLRNN